MKQNALTDLMKMARESTPSLWENQFKDILMSVVEKMKDPEVVYVCFSSCWNIVEKVHSIVCFVRQPIQSPLYLTKVEAYLGQNF